MLLLKEILDSRFLTMKGLLSVIDDDCNKTGRYIIIPALWEILLHSKECEKSTSHKIILAIPSASKKERNILEICKMTKCELKTLRYVSAY